MKPTTQVAVAALLGGLLLLALWAGLKGPARAAHVPSADRGAVVVNEVAWGGTAASASDEWIELYNTTGTTVALDGWHLVDDDDLFISLQGDIPPHGYYLIERTDDQTVSDLSADLIASFGAGLSNDGEVLTLTDASGTVVDIVNPGGGSWPAGSGSPDYRSMERADPDLPGEASNWCSNDGATRNGMDVAGQPINGTPKRPNSCYVPPGLTLVKRGPPVVTPGSLLTYRIGISNTSDGPISSVIVTDALPAELSFVTQTSTLAFSRPASGLLRWDAGDLPAGVGHWITLALRADSAVSGTVTNVATAAGWSAPAQTATWVAPVVPYVRLYALAPANYGGSGEAAALINLGAYTATLSGWCLDDALASSSRVCFPAAAQIGPGQIVWLAQDAEGFYPVWGFDADWSPQPGSRPASRLTGSWPGFTDAGEASYLIDADGHVVDLLVYGDAAASAGWVGAPVPYPYASYSGGQVLYRKLDQATGLPVPDTDRAADWAQDPDDPIDGRRLRYPGWDLEDLFFPAEVATTAHLTIAVAPDGALDLVSRTLASAQHSLRIEAYSLESVRLYQVISDRIRAGVVVTIVLEADPTGAMSDVERWIASRLHDPPTSTVYLIGAAAPRYRFQHAKFALVDERLALVSTDNFGENSMPSDPKINGTFGQRGFVAVTDSPAVVARLAEVFRRDADPAHVDVIPFSDAYAPPPGFVPLPPVDWVSYTAPFSRAVVVTATQVTVLHAPEHALRDQDGLLGLLERAGRGHRVAVMQLNEPVTWTYGAGDVGLNPRVQALVEAARRGAEVRVLLDAYYDDGRNTATCLYLNRLGRREDLDLQCRLANPSGLGIHAKIFLVQTDHEQVVHIGSINGTETSSKVNREVALQFASADAYDALTAVFEHDWDLGRGPLVHHVYLPLACQEWVAPADHPLVSEVFINPSGADSGKEWIELYNPGPTVDVSGWTVGDALEEGDYGDGRYAFPEGSSFLHGQVVVVAACAAEFAAAYGFNPTYELMDCEPLVPDLEPVAAWEGFGLALGNVQDEVLLLRADGKLIDSVAWNGEQRAGVVPFPMDPGDTFPWATSLKRYPPDSDRDDCSQDFYVSWSPSPGRVAGSP